MDELQSDQKALFGRAKIELNTSQGPVFGLTGRQPRSGSLTRKYEEVDDDGTKRTIIVKGLPRDDTKPQERAGKHPEWTKAEDRTESDVWGLPTDGDGDVWVVLLQMYLEQGRPQDRTVRFTMGELARRCGKTEAALGGRVYRSVGDSLVRLKGATIIYVDSWYDKRTKSKTSTETFSLLDAAGMSDSEGGKGYATISKQVIDSVEASYVWSIDLDVLFSLDKPVAKALYRYLVRWMGQPTFSVGLKKLAGRLGFAPGAKPAEIRDSLTDAVDHMGNRGMGIELAFTRGKKDQLAEFEFGQPHKPLPAPSKKRAAKKALPAAEQPALLGPDPAEAFLASLAAETVEARREELRAELAERPIYKGREGGVPAHAVDGALHTWASRQSGEQAGE